MIMNKNLDILLLATFLTDFRQEQQELIQVSTTNF